MGWEFSDLVRFDRGPLLQCHMGTVNLKSAYNLRINGHKGLQWETNL